jgi:hypothetical protein
MYVHIKGEDLEAGFRQWLLEWVCWSVNTYLTIPCLVVSAFANFYQMSRASKNGLLKTARRLI